MFKKLGILRLNERCQGIMRRPLASSLMQQPIVGTNERRLSAGLLKQRILFPPAVR